MEKRKCFRLHVMLPAVFFGERALSFTPRGVLVASVEREFDLTLCGRDAPPCPPRS